MNTVDDPIATARERTGLHDLGTESFHEGLVVLIEGAAAAGSFNEVGIAVIEDQAIRFLANRLQVEDWYRRHPEIDEQVIPPPLFGLGLPRTGSTALSYLQAEDPATRSLRTWETNSPAPPPDPAADTDDPRIAEAEVQISLIDDLAPKFKVMLPRSPTGPNECLQFMCLDFRSAMFAALGDNEPYAEWFDTCDMVSTYRYHERVLKLLQWKYPPGPWRLKSPAHMHSLDALLEVYPDARFVMTHRDTGNENRFFDISFTAMRTDPASEMAHLYDWMGDELTDEVRGRMAAWRDTNPRDKQGVHEYHPEQYGIDLDELRQQFAFYNDRFVGSVETDPAAGPTTTSFGMYVRTDVFKWGLDCPDSAYLSTAICGDLTYRVTGNVGTVRYLGFQANTGMANHSNIRKDQLVCDADGNFELWIGPDERPGNWLQTPPETDLLITRQFFCDWDTEEAASLLIELVSDLPADANTDLLVATPDRVARQLDAVGTWLEANIKFWNDVEVLGQDAKHNAFDDAARHTSLNDHQAVIDDDGVFRAVVAHQDPGVGNWLDTMGHTKGTVVGHHPAEQEGCPSTRSATTSRPAQRGCSPTWPTRSRCWPSPPRSGPCRWGIVPGGSAR